MNVQYLLYAAAMGATGLGARLWVKFKHDRKARAGYETPLIDEAQLALVFMPRAKDGDDPDVLAELHQTFSHLNRQTYAAEFWDMDKQLATYYSRLPDPLRPTMRRALVRLLIANDRWLQVVGAKTSAALLLPEAVPPLRALLEIGDSLRPGDPEKDYGRQDQASDRFFTEIEAALMKLEAQKR